METVTKEIEPSSIDPNQWQRQLIDNRVKVSEDDSINYQAEVLTSRPDTIHSLDFEFKTNILREATFGLALWVSANASVKLSINNRTIYTSVLAASDSSEPLVHHLTLNVTRWTETSVVSHLRLNISYKGQRGATTILLDHERPEWQPELRQEWSWSYALQSLSFFILAWGTILWLALFLVAQVHSLSDTWRFYTVFATVIVWLVGLMGIPDLGRIPLRPILRRLYGATSRHRRYWLLAMFVLFVGASLGAGTFLWCWSVRHSYSALINEALADKGNTQPLREAFVLLPQRKEAQFLFEKEAEVYRNVKDMHKFRAFVRDFVEDPRVKEAVERGSYRSQEYVPYSLVKHSNSDFSDPVLWYASLMPAMEEEGDDQHAPTLEAIKLLSRRKDNPEVSMERLVLEYRIAYKDREKSKRIADELRILLKQADVAQQYASTFTYQLAYDRLATYYVGNCQPDEAIRSFQEELNTRIKQQQGGTVDRWHRPPQLLHLYDAFMAYGDNQTSADMGFAIQLLDKTGQSLGCEPFRGRFLDMVKQYSDYKDDATWRKGTIFEFGFDFDSYIQNSLLNRGWRY